MAEAAEEEEEAGQYSGCCCHASAAPVPRGTHDMVMTAIPEVATR
eukprot:COSAG01_NODE_4576_length_4908_cov_594.918486_2_plen_45_part_00